MKDQDTKTNALCYCKDSTPIKRVSGTTKAREAIKDNVMNPLNTDRTKPWSVFGEWYWI
jgi:hypothetical protein